MYLSFAYPSRYLIQATVFDENMSGSKVCLKKAIGWAPITMEGKLREEWKMSYKYTP